MVNAFKSHYMTPYMKDDNKLFFYFDTKYVIVTIVFLK